MASQKKWKTHPKPAKLSPSLTVRRVLAWADAHRKRTGRWPAARSGAIPEARGETWAKVAQAMHAGFRGLDGSLSLAQALVKYRGKTHPMQLPRLTRKRILEWAEFHHRYNGQWPGHDSGRVLGQPDEDWARIDGALMGGHRGLIGGSSLAKLLGRRRRPPRTSREPPLTVAQVLAWADAHRRRTGQWPQQGSGPVRGAQGEHWRNIDAALRKGNRSLPAGTSLADLLARHRGHRNKAALEKLTLAQILKWIDHEYRRTDRWPVRYGGPVLAAPHENWSSVDVALRSGCRGLPGGASLAKLIDKHHPGRKKNPKRGPAQSARRAR
ncbi:MAG: hypothetical protein IH986_11640 [Planctomycetes bacterium]|nr:hypothetical protein [Planctomycetota bacterium]